MIGSVADSGLATIASLECPLASGENAGASHHHGLASSSGPGLDAEGIYEYEMTNVRLLSIKDGWPADMAVPLRRELKAALLRRVLHEQVPLLRCPSHRAAGPERFQSADKVFRNVTDSGNVYWSSGCWEQEWIENVPFTCRTVVVLDGLSGPPYRSVIRSGDSTVVDIGSAANAFCNRAWWWGVPMIPGGVRAADLRNLTNDSAPQWVRTSQSRRFWVDGIIQLQGQIQSGGLLLAPAVRSFPEKREGIPIGKQLAAAHWLQGTTYPAITGEEAGRLIWHYEDGTSEAVPIVYGRDTARFWAEDGQVAGEVGFPVPVWQKRETVAEVGQDRTLRVYMQTWVNPHPEKRIATLDFVSNMESPAAPFLISITVEP